MLVATGAALRQSIDLIASLEIDRSRMHANIETTKGLALAEAASFALSIHLPRPEAQALVKESCKMVLADGGHLIDLLAQRTAAPGDWDALSDPGRQAGAAEAFIDRGLSARGEGTMGGPGGGEPSSP